MNFDTVEQMLEWAISMGAEYIDMANYNNGGIYRTGIQRRWVSAIFIAGNMIASGKDWEGHPTKFERVKGIHADSKEWQWTTMENRHLEGFTPIEDAMSDPLVQGFARTYNKQEGGATCLS